MKGLTLDSRRAAARPFRPGLEALEDRLALSGFQMLLEQPGFSPLTIADNGPGDISPQAGVIVFAGSYGTFPVNVISGVSLRGASGEANLLLSSVNVAGPQGGALRILLSDDTYLPSGPAGQGLALTSGHGGTQSGGGSSVQFGSHLADGSGNALAGTIAERDGPATSNPFAGEAEPTSMSKPAGALALVNEANIVVAAGSVTSFGMYSSLQALQPEPEPPIVIDPGLLIPGE